MAAGDEYMLYLNDMNSPIASDVLLDVKAKALLSINQVPSGEVLIRGRVRRAGSLQNSYSPIEKVLIIPTHPAGFDQEVTKPWHSGLSLSIENLPMGSIIDSDIAAQGFVCLIDKPLNARKNDVYVIFVGGIRTEYQLTEKEAKGPGPIKVKIGPEVLSQIIPNGEIEVVFTVRNVVGNSPGGDYQFSKSYKLISEKDPSLLVFPYFLKNGEPADYLDLSADSQALLEMEVTPLRASPIPRPLNMITGIVTLLQEDGGTKVVRLPPVTDSGRGSTLRIPLTYDLFKSLANGRFRLAYESHTPAGVVLRTSGSALVNVGGLPVSLPAVTIAGLLAGILTSDKDTNATIPRYFPYSPNFQEKFLIVATDGNLIYEDTQFAGAEGGTRRVTKETLKTFEGKRVQIYYTVDKGEGTSASLLTSEKLDVQIGKWIEELDAPIVQLATDGFIDSASLHDDEFLVTFPFSYSRKGDTLNWSWTGMNSAGSATGTFSINSATEGKNLPFILYPLERRLVDNNQDAQISFKYRVSQSGTPPVVSRSKVAYLTIGKRPVLDPAEVLEAGPLQYEILPKAVIKGATVLANFTNASAQDRVTVHWVGKFNLSTAEVPAVWNPKSKNFSALIDPQVISKGVRKDGNQISVWYSFIRGHTTFTSEPKSFLLKPLEYRPAPVIVDAGATEMLLQLYRLTDKAIIRVLPWDLISVGNNVILQLTGTFVDGTPYTDSFIDGTVTADHISKGYSLAAPVENLLRLQDRSRLNIKCWVNLTNSGDKNVAMLFEENNYVVEAIATTQPAPAFANIPGGKISVYAPDHAKKAFLTVSVAGMRPEQKFTPEIIFPDGTLATITAQNGVSTGRIDFPISDDILAKMVNKVMTMRYTVTTFGTKPITSAPQEVTVQPLREGDLPQVLLNNIPNNGTIDLNIKSNIKVLASLATWPLMIKGQRVSIDLKAKDITPLNIEFAIDAEQAINGIKDKEVNRSWLDTVTPNTQILITGSVRLDGSNATALRTTTYNLVTPLKLNASTINLSGLSIKVPGWPKTGLESNGNTATLIASGGTGKVTWASRKPTIASVNASGLVVGMGWGTTIIDATDSAGNTVSCTVNVSQVYRLVINETQTNFPAALAWINTGNRQVGWDGVYDLQRVYGVRLPVTRHYWFGVTTDPATAVFYHWQNLGVASGGRNDHLFGAWTLVNLIG